MSDHALIVPPIGIMQILHTDGHIHMEDTLRNLYPTDTEFITVRFTTAEGSMGVVGFFPARPVINLRAQEALRILTGAHMVLTGPVIFTGVPDLRLGEVVATLSVD